MKRESVSRLRKQVLQSHRVGAAPGQIGAVVLHAGQGIMKIQTQYGLLSGTDEEVIEEYKKRANAEIDRLNATTKLQDKEGNLHPLNLPRFS